MSESNPQGVRPVGMADPASADNKPLYFKDAEWFDAPMPLIGLVGREDIHQAIVNNVPKLHALNFTTVPTTPYPFPRKKARRTSYEGYEPNGIIGINWVRKHAFIIPSVVLYLLEWDDKGEWERQEQQIPAAINKFRADTAGRDTRQILVFLRHKTTQEDENTFMERWGRAARKAGMEHISKSIATVAPNDFKTSLKKLEALCNEVAHDYCKTFGKRVKHLKHRVNKAAQPKLYVRHQFKVAFFAEMLHDYLSAHKYYNSAYSFLKQVVLSNKDVLAVEPKQLAEIINFKIIRVLLCLKRGPDALEQFRTHIFRWKTVVGPDDLAFVHHAWMAQQYTLFADLLEGSNEIPHSRQHNSGYYYQTAATYASKRKVAAIEIFKKGARVDERSAFLPPQYMGQTCTKKGSLNSSVLDCMFSSYLSDEAGVNHSALILTLLTKACESFKKEKATRMYLHTAALMGVEYHSTQNWSTAKRCFDRIAKTYRNEKWPSILTHVLSYALDCARKLNAPRDVVNYLLELMGRDCKDPGPKKEGYFQELMKMVETTSIPPAVKASPSMFGECFEVDRRHDLITCSAAFNSDAAHVNGEIDVRLQVRVNFPREVVFREIIPIFNPPAQSTKNPYNFALVGGEEGEGEGEDQRKFRELDSSEGPCFQHVITIGDYAEDASQQQQQSDWVVSAARRSRSNTRFLPKTMRDYHCKFRATHPTPQGRPLTLMYVYFLVDSPSPSPSPSPPASPSTPSSSIPLVLRCPVIPKQQLLNDEDSAFNTNFNSGANTYGAMVITPARAMARVKLDQAGYGPALLNELYQLNFVIHSHADVVRNPTLTLEYTVQDGAGDQKVEEESWGAADEGSAPPVRSQRGSLSSNSGTTALNPSTALSALDVKGNNNSSRKKSSNAGLGDVPTFFIVEQLHNNNLLEVPGGKNQNQNQNNVNCFYLTPQSAASLDPFSSVQLPSTPSHSNSNSNNFNMANVKPVEGAIKLGVMPPHTLQRCTIFMRCRVPRTHTITAKLAYENDIQLHGGGVCALSHTETYTVQVQTPFNVSYRFFSQSTNAAQVYKVVNTASAQSDLTHPVLLLCQNWVDVEVENCSVHPLQLKAVRLCKPDPALLLLDDENNPTEEVKDILLGSGEKYSTVVCIRPLKEITTPSLPLAQLDIHWCRAAGDKSKSAQSPPPPPPPDSNRKSSNTSTNTTSNNSKETSNSNSNSSSNAVISPRKPSANESSSNSVMPKSALDMELEMELEEEERAELKREKAMKANYFASEEGEGGEGGGNDSNDGVKPSDGPDLTKLVKSTLEGRREAEAEQKQQEGDEDVVEEAENSSSSSSSASSSSAADNNNPELSEQHSSELDSTASANPQGTATGTGTDVQIDPTNLTLKSQHSGENKDKDKDKDKNQSKGDKKSSTRQPSADLGKSGGGAGGGGGGGGGKGKEGGEDVVRAPPRFVLSFLSQFPLIKVKRAPVEVVVERVGSCMLGATFVLALTLTNHTTAPCELDIAIPEVKQKKGPAYCFAGLRSGKVTVLPMAVERLLYRIIPLESGYLTLPRINLKCGNALLIDPEEIGQVFVNPQQRLVS